MGAPRKGATTKGKGATGKKTGNAKGAGKKAGNKSSKS